MAISVQKGVPQVAPSSVSEIYKVVGTCGGAASCAVTGDPLFLPVRGDGVGPRRSVIRQMCLSCQFGTVGLLCCFGVTRVLAT